MDKPNQMVITVTDTNSTPLPSRHWKSPIPEQQAAIYGNGMAS